MALSIAGLTIYLGYACLWAWRFIEKKGLWRFCGISFIALSIPTFGGFVFTSLLTSAFSPGINIMVIVAMMMINWILAVIAGIVLYLLYMVVKAMGAGEVLGGMSIYTESTVNSWWARKREKLCR